MPKRPKAKDHLAINITGLEPTVPDIYPLAFWSPPVGYGKAQGMGKWEPGSLPHLVSQLPPSLEPQNGPSSLGCKWFAQSLHGGSRLVQKLKNSYGLYGTLAEEGK